MTRFDYTRSIVIIEDSNAVGDKSAFWYWASSLLLADDLSYPIRP